MIEFVHFGKFKALRDTTLPLGPFTLIVGPNGAGKSTALQALRAAAEPHPAQFAAFVNAEAAADAKTIVTVTAKWSHPTEGVQTTSRWHRSRKELMQVLRPGDAPLSDADRDTVLRTLQGMRLFSLDSKAIARAVPLQKRMILMEDGGHLAGVLDRLRDDQPERFQLVNEALARWLPEFDQILFDTPDTGQRAFCLRTSKGGHKIPANQLSDGTLLALTMLTLAYIPEPPPIIGLEEPDRGIHPRLLRDVQDALYRLAYPENFGEDREPVQVIATTHSPYFVDLFGDHPEEIVIAEKLENEARFVRLTDLDNIDDILRDARLGEAWYTGILGGVPSGS